MTESFAAELNEHYTQVRERLWGDHRVKKLSWTTPTIELIWEKPPTDLLHIEGLIAPLSVHMIIGDTMKEYGVTFVELIGDCRIQKLNIARQHCWYSALSATKISASELARIFRRDHSTILYGVKSHAKRNSLPIPRMTYCKTLRSLTRVREHQRKSDGRFCG